LSRFCNNFGLRSWLTLRAEKAMQMLISINNYITRRKT
jgi:hypothetical protein